MRKIYLASDSKARKKLLKIFGIKFKVLPSRIEEKRRAGVNFSALVKANALLKAKDAAKKVKSGVIIGADTVVVAGNKIFGKPKDLKSARKMLKYLSGRAQWLYTGIAVIDKDNNKILTECEKTKIYMDKLSIDEIDNYFKQVSPLDKAGSFDIQGKGAFFIRRIEGCFYNVVGLPLRRLYLMLKKINVKVFIFLTLLSPVACCLLLNGCSTEYNLATKQEESYYFAYSTDKEVQMGEAIAKEVAKEYKFADDPLLKKRVEDIGKKIAAVCDRKDIDYHFEVLDDDDVNAVSLPGGYVYVNKGLIDRVANDDELAGVLGHEIGHIVARHSIKKLQATQAYSILRVLAAATPNAGGVGSAADIAFAQFITGYGRDDELLADRLGARYARLAGYNPRAMIDFLKKLQDVNRKRPLQPKAYFKTHPYVPDRIRVVKQELDEQMNFDDYINIEQTKFE